MTTRRSIVLTTTLVLAVAALPMLAAAGGPGDRPSCTGDGPGPYGRGAGHGAFGPGGGPGMGGPGMGFSGPGLERFLDRAATWLDLTADQESQIQSILDSSRADMESLREQARSQRQAFDESYDPASFDESAVRTFASQQAQLHTEMVVQGMRTWSQVYQVLTPEQRELLDNHRQNMQERHGKRGRRGGPGQS